MKKVTILVLLMTIGANRTFAQTNLSLGDLAFVAWNADGTDQFSFVLLKDIVTGTQISFTDNGWTGSAFRPGENTITWTANQAGSVGDIITVTGTSVTTGTITGTALAQATSGDSIIAYQGSAIESNFISGIQMNGVWDAGATSSTTSAKPSVFTDGVNSVSISPEVDNAVYQGTLSGSAFALRASINTLSNWVLDNTNAFSLPGDIGSASPADTDHPVFDATPTSSSITQTGFTLSTDINEAGTIYYVVVANGATAPTSANVKAGQSSGGGSVLTSGNGVVNSGGFTNNFSVTGLSAGTAYDVYVVAQDDESSPNIQASPTKVDVTTLAPTSIQVAATVFLEGAWNGSSAMNTNLEDNDLIATSAPYNGVNSHSGSESVVSAAAVPDGAVDWVLVELREAGSAAGAVNSTRKGSAAGFLMSNGSIKGTDGTSNLSISLSGNTGTNYYVVIYHRNHLPIMSASAIVGTSGTLTIDFTSNSANTYQTTTALVALTGGKFGLPAGDTNSSGTIDGSDLTVWRNNNGTAFSYSGSGIADFNLDGVVNAVDRNGFYQKNTSKTRQVPTSI